MVLPSHACSLLLGNVVSIITLVSFIPQLFKNSRKLQLWVTSHGQRASVHYATKMFRWVDAHGRPTPPPPESYQPAQFGGHRHELDERKVANFGSGLKLGLIFFLAHR